MPDYGEQDLVSRFCPSTDRETRENVERLAREAKQARAVALAAIDKIKEATKARAEETAREKERAKRELEEQRVKAEFEDLTRLLHKYQLECLIPFYVQRFHKEGEGSNRNVSRKLYYVFHIPGYHYLYLNFAPDHLVDINGPVEMKYRNSVEMWSQNYRTLGELLIDAEIPKPGEKVD